MKSNLEPFLRDNLDILFIGLNPALGSSNNRHYFSVNQSFWNQLLSAGLIIEFVDKSNADDLIFGSNHLNLNNFQYGVTDLVTDIAESDSTKIRPTLQHNILLKNTLIQYHPKIAVILHNKVLKSFFRFLQKPIPDSNAGYLGKILENCNTHFFTVAFPHGNTIPSVAKINRYKEIKEQLLSMEL